MKFVSKLILVALTVSPSAAFAATNGSLAEACCALAACCGLPCC